MKFPGAKQMNRRKPPGRSLSHTWFLRLIRYSVHVPLSDIKSLNREELEAQFKALGRTGLSRHATAGLALRPPRRQLGCDDESAESTARKIARAVFLADAGTRPQAGRGGHHAEISLEAGGRRVHRKRFDSRQPGALRRERAIDTRSAFPPRWAAPTAAVSAPAAWTAGNAISACMKSWNKFSQRKDGMKT